MFLTFTKHRSIKERRSSNVWCIVGIIAVPELVADIALPELVAEVSGAKAVWKNITKNILNLYTKSLAEM